LRLSRSLTVTDERIICACGVHPGSAQALELFTVERFQAVIAGLPSSARSALTGAQAHAIASARCSGRCWR